MALLVAVLTTLGVLAALLSNATNILKYLQDRRERAAALPAPSRSPTAAAEHGLTVAAPSDRGTPTHAILTPDQRLRVFLSSTLGELAEERAAARAAIDALHLSPVLFELGARPHAPRDLYRAYLAQSQVFVGIYWQSYGWVAPHETVSGLEDEYRLAGERPRLIYVKEPAPDREPRLEALLEQVRNEGKASYKRFRDAAELGALLRDDLAVLLTERFLLPEAIDAPAATAPWTADLALPPLPLALTSFVARESLLGELVALLRRPEVRLVTLVGPGGIGKSRLALECCRVLGETYPDGVAYVALDTLRDPTLLAATILRALNVAEVPGRDSEAQVTGWLADKRLLLVLDNFEGLLDGAPLAARMLRSCKDLTMIVTSRSLLRLSGEVSFPVPPMRLPGPGSVADADEALRFGAVRLFVERARSVAPDFELDADNLPAVVEVCRRLDGLPLAIELAAARLRSVTVPTLLERMTLLLPLLTGGARDAPDRQRTLRSTIEWSYNLLEPREQRLFRRLAVFTGGSSLPAAESVLVEDPAVLDGLTSLIDKSLVQMLSDVETPRYQMLETVREYAQEHLDMDPDVGAVRKRHAAYFLAFAERAAPELTGAQQSLWLDRLRLEEGNLRSAQDTFLAEGQPTEALRMAVALRAFWTGVGAVAEGRGRLRTALEAATDASPSLRAWGIGTAAVLAWRQGDLAAARPLLEDALRGFRAVSDKRGEATALRVLGMLSHNQARYQEAQRYLADGLALYRSIGDEEGVANTLLSLGNVRLDQGDPQSEALYGESRDVADAIDDTLGVAHALDNLGVAAWYFDRPQEAERLCDEALALYQGLGHPAGIANVAHRRGLLAFGGGDLDAAERHFVEALSARRALGDARGSAFVLYDLARVALRRNDLASARTRLREGLALAREQVARVIEVLYLEGTAALLDRDDCDEEAYVLLLVAGKTRADLGVPVAPVNRARHARRLRRLTHALDASARTRAESKASDLPFEAALAMAEAVLQERDGDAP